MCSSDLNIDIAAINETKLSTTSRFNFPGYITYRTDRNQHGGGVILIKHNIRHDQFIIHNLTGLEVSAVYSYPQHTSKLLSFAAYQPPSTPLSTADLDQIFAQNDSVLIVGDLNSKHVSWKNTSVNRNGRTLVTYCIDNQVTISYPDQATYFPHHSTPSVCPLPTEAAGLLGTDFLERVGAVVDFE